MKIIISILFIVEFILLMNFFIQVLYKKGFSFKLGLTFGVLYFIFIPIGILIFTGKVNLVKTDFSHTTLTDVYLNKDLKASFILILYILSLIIYLYFFKKKEKKEEISFKPRLKFYLFIYFISQLIILLGSGLLEGGNWYHARHLFMIKYGTLGVFLAFITNATKILIIASIIYLWTKKELKFLQFLFYILSFTLFDMFISGNRIYLFTTFVLVGLIILKRKKLKILISLPFLLPIVYYVGYFGSIFRHIRGPLFQNGIPTLKVFNEALARAIKLDPPNLTSFFLNISESVNFNVIYNIINNFDKSLYGATYLKTFVFYIPRSIWQDKPESITKITANYFGSSSLVTTIFGEMHMNFSYIGILLLPLILYLTDSFLSYFKFNNQIFKYILFMMGILIFRMPFSDEILTYIFLLLIIYISNKKFVLKKNINEEV